MRLNIKQLLKEYHDWKDYAWKNMNPYNIQFGDITKEPFWMQLKREQEHTNRRAKEFLKKYTKIDLVVKDFELNYIKLNDYQMRVKNPRNGKFIDWWKGKKQRMLNAKAEYTNYTNEKSIVKEILKLI